MELDKTTLYDLAVFANEEEFSVFGKLNEAITSSMRQMAKSAGPAGIVALAVAAFDIAFWDIKGKALGHPLCTLLGRTLRTKWRVHTSSARRSAKTLT